MGTWLHRKRFINDKRSTAENDHKAEKENEMKLSAQRKAELLDSILIEIDYNLRVYNGKGISEEVLAMVEEETRDGVYYFEEGNRAEKMKIKC